MLNLYLPFLQTYSKKLHLYMLLLRADGPLFAEGGQLYTLIFFTITFLYKFYFNLPNLEFYIQTIKSLYLHFICANFFPNLN